MLAATPPGFGGSAVPAGFDYSVESYAAPVGQLLQQEGVDALVAPFLLREPGD